METLHTRLRSGHRYHHNAAFTRAAHRASRRSAPFRGCPTQHIALPSRNDALALVTGSLQKLQRLSEELEDLRSRASTADRMEANLPIEVQVGSLRRSIDRLEVSRTRAMQRQETVERQRLEADGSEDLM